MNVLKYSYSLLILGASSLFVGCQNPHNEPAGFDGYPWVGLKVSLHAPSSALHPKMWIRCVVLDASSLGVEEGLYDWDVIEELRDRLGDKVVVRNTCVLEGLKDGSAESGYYLTTVNPEICAKSLHGLRLQVHDVRIEGQELTFNAELLFGRHQSDVPVHDGRRKLDEDRA